MAKNNNIGDLLQSVANAIRTRKGTTEPINAQNFDQEILDIPSGMNSIDETADVIKACGGEFSYDDATLANGVAKLFADEPSENTFNGTRTTADGGAIRDGVAYVSKVKGKTLKVHQRSSPRTSTLTSGDVTIVGLGDGGYTINGIATGNYSGYYLIPSYKFIANHKYLFHSGNKELLLTTSYNWVRNNRFIVTATEEKTGNVSIWITGGQTYDNVIAYPMFFDLTEMFGSGNEPTTPDEFAQRLGYATIDDIPYIPYTETPQLVSLTASGVKSKEKTIMWNQLYSFTDHDIISGQMRMYYLENGLFNLRGNAARNYGYFKNKIIDAGDVIFCYFRVIERDPSSWGMSVTMRTASSSDVIDSIQLNSTRNYAILKARESVNTFQTQILYAANTDIDIKVYFRLHNLTTMFGAGNEPSAEEFIAMFPNDYYEPNTGEELNYNLKSPMVSTLPLPIDQIVDESGNKVFPYGLLGVGDAHDEIDLERGVAVKRCGRSLISTLSIYKSTTNLKRAYGRIKDGKYTNTQAGVLAICSAYTVITGMYSTLKSGEISVGNYVDGLNICGYIIQDDTFENMTIEQIKEKLANEVIIYPLATPIEYPLPSKKAYYKVQANGTEELVSEELSAPLTADIGYRGSIEAEALNLL